MEPFFPLFPLAALRVPSLRSLVAQQCCGQVPIPFVLGDLLREDPALAVRLGDADEMVQGGEGGSGMAPCSKGKVRHTAPPSLS